MPKPSKPSDPNKLNESALNRVYTKAKIKASPYDYSLRDRVVLESIENNYHRVTNAFLKTNRTELELARRLGAEPASDELRHAAFSISSTDHTYEFPGIDYRDEDVKFGDLGDTLKALLHRNKGIAYKHNNLIVNEHYLSKISSSFSTKASEALIGLYARLYAKDSITPQLALTLVNDTKGASLDSVANLTYVKEALDKGKDHVPDVFVTKLSGQTLAQIFLLGIMERDSSSDWYPGHPKWGDLYSEILRQNVIESAMYMCEIYRAFNLMDVNDRTALAPVLFQDAKLLDIKYDPDDAKYKSPEFDAFSAEPADVRFEKIQAYVEDQLRANFPEVYAWSHSDVARLTIGFDVPIYGICSDLHQKAWEDFRVKNFALLLQACKDKGIDVSDLQSSAKSIGGASAPGADDDDDDDGDDDVDGDFGSMRRGVDYGSGDDAGSDDLVGKKPKASPQLETMSNLIKSCETRYDIEVEDVPNDMGLKNNYLKLMKPIEFLTKNLTKQIRAIKTYNVGGKNSGKTRGKLDTHTMYRYRTDPKIFYDITYKIREMDLAFGIILDQSGSMSGEGIANGMVSLIMLHHVLAALRINHAVIGHTSNRFNNVIIKKYVSFNEDPAHTMEVPYMLSNLRAYSGNCDSGALNYMEQYIKRVRNKDKIVIIFSDGEPTECSESDLVAQVRKMEREGIHVIGLGVDFDNIKHYYPDHANGRNLAEMVNILVDVLKRYVLEKHS
jgi:hypothetical protein